MDKLNEASFFPRIVFKLKDYIPIRGDDTNDITRYFRHLPQEQWRQLFWSCHHISINRMFCTLKSGEIASIIERARKMDPNYKDPQLLSYFILVSPDEKTSSKALLKLLAMDEVETAYQQGGLKSPAAPAKKKIFLLQQHT